MQVDNSFFHVHVDLGQLGKKNFPIPSLSLKVVCDSLLQAGLRRQVSYVVYVCEQACVSLTPPKGQHSRYRLVMFVILLKNDLATESLLLVHI